MGIRHYRTKRKAPEAQCKCAWCGKWMTDTEDCLNTAQKLALRTFARLNSSTWKSKLLALWANGTADELLMQCRNIIGPSGLDRLNTSMVRDWEPKPKI